MTSGTHIDSQAIIRSDQSLEALNTLGLPSTAAHYAAPESLEALSTVLATCQQQGWPLHVLGGGSNVIVAPQVGGLVLHYAADNYWLEQQADTTLLHVDAGVRWPRLVEAITAQGYWGIENLALIPGCAGAAPVQNIGAYGVELSDVLYEVECMDIRTQNLRVLSNQDCAFGYRDSIFKHALAGQVVITRIVLKLTTQGLPRLAYADLAERVGNDLTPARIAATVSAIRREKLPDPAVLANAGSFFKNPIIDAIQARHLRDRYPDIPCYPAENGVKVAAGWLIDQCGLKGIRRGHFGIHARQALVLVHTGDGSGEELMAFAQDIMAKVKETFGIELEPEPRPLGWE